MMNELKKILLQDEFEFYHAILSSYGVDLLNDFKETLLGISYDEDKRILKFGRGALEQLVITDDGVGNVVFTFSQLTTVDDGEGNVNSTGLTTTDDGNGNVYTN